MKKRILVLMVGFLLIGINGFAADGDVVINGTLTVQGIKITHVTGTNPTCPSGTGAIAKKFAATACYGQCSICTLNAGWAPADWSCLYANFSPVNGECTAYSTCVPTSWSEVICMGN